MNLLADPTSFYVMQNIAGEECLLYTVPTYAEAVAKVEVVAADIKRHLSIWGNNGGIVSMVHPITGAIVLRHLSPTVNASRVQS